jgi:uncharacterized protein
MNLMSPSDDPSHEAQTDVDVHFAVKIPLRDGIELVATVYLPAGQDASAPSIFVMTPYVRQRHHDRGMYFAARGFPFLTVDVRGRGDSGGEFGFAQDAADVFEVVEWLAEQPFCNGKVAMWGGSYSGHLQWSAIRKRSPHLATIVPVAAPFRGVDSPLRNNVFTPYTMQWLTLISGRASQDRLFLDQSFWSRRFRDWFEAGKPFCELDRFVGNPSPLFQEFLSHPHQDPYWDRFNPGDEQYSLVAIPVLTITGAYDADQPGALAHYRAHMRNASDAARATHFLVIGPWDHSGCGTPSARFGGIEVGPASLLDLQELHLQWYAWTMRGGPKPPFLKKNVAWYVTGAERWRYADSLEEITARHLPLFLASACNPVDVFHSGTLNAGPSDGGGPDQYRYDPADVTLADLESTVEPGSLTDQRLTHRAIGKQLVYHSAPFESDTQVSGFFSLVLWIAIDQPDTDFRAAVFEIDVSGGATCLSTDWLRARYRTSFRAEALVTSGEALRYEFQRFTFVSREIGKGHRLRLVIGPINSIYMQKNYNTGGDVARESVADARPVTVKVFRDGAHPSALYVPLGRQETE